MVGRRPLRLELSEAGRLFHHIQQRASFDRERHLNGVLENGDGLQGLRRADQRRAGQKVIVLPSYPQEFFVWPENPKGYFVVGSPTAFQALKPPAMLRTFL